MTDLSNFHLPVTIPTNSEFADLFLHVFEIGDQGTKGADPKSWLLSGAWPTTRSAIGVCECVPARAA